MMRTNLIPRRRGGDGPSFAFAGLGPVSASADLQGRPRFKPGRRILIVEDEYFIAIEIDRWLSEAGHEVSGIVGSANDALAAALDQHPDLVLMDVRLAGNRDGIAAAHDIFLQTGIRCLFASAHFDPATQNRAAAAEPLGWLPKPYSKLEFLAALDAAITQLDSNGN